MRGWGSAKSRPIMGNKVLKCWGSTSHAACPVPAGPFPREHSGASDPPGCCFWHLGSLATSPPCPLGHRSLLLLCPVSLVLGLPKLRHVSSLALALLSLPWVFISGAPGSLKAHREVSRSWLLVLGLWAHPSPRANLSKCCWRAGRPRTF